MTGLSDSIASVWGALLQRADDFRRDEDGATAVEYCLLIALIFLAIVGAVNSFSDSSSVMYEEIRSNIAVD